MRRDRTNSTFHSDERIEFSPNLGEDALIGRAIVRPRGRSSSSSINHHGISSKQQRSSSITNSPDPSIITSDAAEPTAAGSRGAPATRRRLSVTRRPFRGLCHATRGYRSAQRQFISSILTSKSKNAIGARALYSPLSLPRIFLHLAVYSGTVAISTENYTEGLHPERPARVAVLYTGQFRPCIEHKGPPSTKNMHTKDGHDSRGRNYKAETQLPTFAWASLPI